MTTNGTTGKTKTPFLAFVSKEADLDTLKRFATNQRWGDACVMQGDIRNAAQFLKIHSSPEMLLVEIPSAQEAPALLDALADVCNPDTKVVVTGTVNEFSFYCWLKEIGIFHYLLQPLSEQNLLTTWQQAIAPPPTGAKTAKEPGRVIGFLGSRGGCGNTSLSLLVAGLLEQHSNKTIALVDLDPLDGSISLLLDLEPSRGFREALEKPDRIDSLFLDRVMLKARERLHVLSTEESLNERVVYHDHAADALLKTLREKFDIILLDIPHRLCPFTKACLRECEHVLVVSDTTLQGLRDAMRLNDTFREHMKLKSVRFIANRIGMTPKFEISLSDFEKSLGTKVEFRMPFAPEVFMQTGPDLPGLKQHANPALKALQQIAVSILPEMDAPEDAQEKKNLLSLLKKK